MAGDVRGLDLRKDKVKLIDGQTKCLLVKGQDGQTDGWMDVLTKENRQKDFVQTSIKNWLY